MIHKSLAANVSVIAHRLGRTLTTTSAAMAASHPIKTYPTEVTIVEVGPRDGLQNEKMHVASEIKVEFINRLSKTGLRRIEATSFVSPKWVPQFADAKQVMSSIERNPLVRYSTLTPNLNGFNSALESRTDEVAIFGAASETFTRKNINCSIDESLERFTQVCAAAAEAKIPVRGYVSCVLGCPYEGRIEPAAVCRVVEKLLQLGCYEISLGDTIGVGNPATTNRLLTALRPVVNDDMSRLAIHCHDTYGLALANIAQALEHGIRVVDASCGGLGGCPYAGQGVSGNVATEDVLYMLNGMGIATGVDLAQIIDCSEFILGTLARKPSSRVGIAMSRKK